MNIKVFTTSLFFLLISFQLFSQQIIKKSIKKEAPLVFLDGKAISQTEMQQIDANDIAALTILKEASAIKQYGEKGKAGVILIESKKHSRNQFQKYFSSKSSEYKSVLTQKSGSDIRCDYFLDGKLLTKN